MCIVALNGCHSWKQYVHVYMQPLKQTVILFFDNIHVHVHAQKPLDGREGMPGDGTVCIDW